jgi:glycosyltransferase involved in cell wall biosynthesis
MADMLLFPSDGESFGLAAAEAMASETPVLGARAGGLPEVVLDGETGVLCEVGDHEALTRAAVDLLDRPDRLRAMGRAGRERVKTHFSPEIVVPQYENYYAMLLRRVCGGEPTPSFTHRPQPIA